MELLYKSQKSNDVIEYYANVVNMHNNEVDEDFSVVRKAIEDLKNGINIKQSCQIIHEELDKADNQNISCQSLFDTRVIGYVIPYITADLDIELLECTMSIINKASFIDQPVDSPLQEKLFIENLISIFQSYEFIDYKIKSLYIILNLLRDDNISENIFLILTEIGFVQILVNSNFLNISYAKKITKDFDYKFENPSLISSEVLSDYLNIYPTEKLIDFIEIIPLLSEGIIDKTCESLTRRNFAKSLSIILQNPETHLVAYESKVPKNCVKSLTLYQEDSVAEIFDCIYYLMINNDKIESFLKPKFIRICMHLLDTVKNPDEDDCSTDYEDILEHMLRFLDFYMPKYIKDIKDISQILFDIVLTANRPFRPRIAASLVLIKCMKYQDQNYINILLEKQLFTFIFDNILSYEKEEIEFILDALLKKFETNEAIKNQFLESKDFNDMLNELAEYDDPEISKLPMMFN